jgi:hypothetical protein
VGRGTNVLPKILKFHLKYIKLLICPPENFSLYYNPIFCPPIHFLPSAPSQPFTFYRPFQLFFFYPFHLYFVPSWAFSGNLLLILMELSCASALVVPKTPSTCPSTRKLSPGEWPWPASNSTTESVSHFLFSCMFGSFENVGVDGKKIDFFIKKIEVFSR